MTETLLTTAKKQLKKGYSLAWICVISMGFPTLFRFSFRPLSLALALDIQPPTRAVLNNKNARCNPTNVPR